MDSLNFTLFLMSDETDEIYYKCFSLVNDDDVSTACIVIIPKGQQTQIIGKSGIMLYFVGMHYT